MTSSATSEPYKAAVIDSGWLRPTVHMGPIHKSGLSLCQPLSSVSRSATHVDAEQRTHVIVTSWLYADLHAWRHDVINMCADRDVPSANHNVFCVSAQIISFHIVCPSVRQLWFRDGASWRIFSKHLFSERRRRKRTVGRETKATNIVSIITHKSDKTRTLHTDG